MIRWEISHNPKHHILDGVKLRTLFIAMSILAAAVQAAATVDQFKSSGTNLTASGSKPGFNYNFFATETTIRGKDGNTLVVIGVGICTGAPDQIPSNCLTAFGSVDGRLLTRRGSIATLNIPDAVAAGLTFQSCDEFGCFPMTPPGPFQIQVTLRANGLFTNEFDGITRVTQNAGAATSHFYSNGKTSNQSATIQGRIGSLTLPALDLDFESAVIGDAKTVTHVILRETKP